MTSYYWLVSKTTMRRKLLPNLYHKLKDEKVKILQSLFNFHQSQWHADWQRKTANTYSCLFNYYKNLWHADGKYPIILWQNEFPCSLKTMVWSDYYAGGPEIRAIPAFQQHCTSQPHELGIF